MNWYLSQQKKRSTFCFYLYIIFCISDIPDDKSVNLYFVSDLALNVNDPHKSPWISIKVKLGLKFYFTVNSWQNISDFSLINF